MADVFQQFLGLRPAISATEFASVPLSAVRKDFLAKNPDGAPVFLLHDASSPQYTPGRQLKYLSVEFHTTCRVQTEDGELQNQFALVTCDAGAIELHELFVRCFGVAIEELPPNCATKELEDCVHQVLNLFRALSEPSGKEVSGLWAELWVIANSGNIPKAMAVWREDLFERFDFSWDLGCLEVKASTRGLRVHDFALEQLMRPSEGVGYVASLMLQPLSGGCGVLDLAKRIDSLLVQEPLLRKTLWKNVTSALGKDFSEKLDKRFDASYAERNLILYNMADIPTVDQPKDSRVSAVRFVADLSAVTSSVFGAPMSNLSIAFRAVNSD